MVSNTMAYPDDTRPSDLYHIIHNRIIYDNNIYVHWKTGLLIHGFPESGLGNGGGGGRGFTCNASLNVIMVITYRFLF